MTGWNMPPGVNESDIPGNRPDDLLGEQLADELLDKDLVPLAWSEHDEHLTKLVEYIIEQMSKASAEGYSEGHYAGKCEEAENQLAARKGEPS